MGNLGGAELLVIFLVGLVVLGPAKLPEAARQIGKAVNELRRVSGGFQQELRDALHEPVAETKAILNGTPLPDTPRTPPAPVVDAPTTSGTTQPGIPAPGTVSPGAEAPDTTMASPTEPSDDV
jgi:Tat protein translocase TatB subunit